MALRVAACVGACVCSTEYWVHAPLCVLSCVAAGECTVCAACAATRVSRAAACVCVQYWAASFNYMRHIAVFECDWANFNAVLGTVNNISDPTARTAAARAELLPARISLVRAPIA